MHPSNMYMSTVPSEAWYDYDNDISYVVIDEPAFEAMMERIDQGLPPTEK